MKKAAVVGSPISHSKSPAIFSFLAKELARHDFEYGTRNISSSELESFVRELRSDSEWLGVNVTIPHKQKVIALLDEINAEAERIQAVNVVCNQAGILRGHNTDVLGIQSTLAQNQMMSELRGKNALIFGAGGAARAVAYVLGQARASEVIVYSQNLDSARILAKDFNLRAIDSFDWIRDIEFSLLVNCTPLGMAGVYELSSGKSGADFFSPLKKLKKTSNALAFDLIYNPEMTVFLSTAEEAGFRTVGGLSMLVEQALATWEIWFGKDPKISKARPGLLEHLRMAQKNFKHRPIFLTGFMGVGKSLIGGLLARELGWDFLDTDKLIEQESKQSIADIFSQKGENSFRELEKRIVNQVSVRTRAVVALGGGAVVSPENFRVLSESGILVYLQAEPDALLRRLEKNGDSRPLLAGLDSEARRLRIQRLLSERLPVYSKSELEVKTDEQTPEQVVQVILDYLRLAAA